MYSQKLILFLVAANDVRTSATKTLGESISDLLKQGLQISSRLYTSYLLNYFNETNLTKQTVISYLVISKLDKQQQDITAIKNHLISAVDVDLDTIESLLPSGNRLNTSAEVEEFQDSLDDDSKKKLVRNQMHIVYAKCMFTKIIMRKLKRSKMVDM